MSVLLNTRDLQKPVSHIIYYLSQIIGFFSPSLFKVKDCIKHIE